MPCGKWRLGILTFISLIDPYWHNHYLHSSPSHIKEGGEKTLFHFAGAPKFFSVRCIKFFMKHMSYYSHYLAILSNGSIAFGEKFWYWVFTSFSYFEVLNLKICNKVFRKWSDQISKVKKDRTIKFIYAIKCICYILVRIRKPEIRHRKLETGLKWISQKWF